MLGSRSRSEIYPSVRFNLLPRYLDQGLTLLVLCTRSTASSGTLTTEIRFVLQLVAKDLH